MTKLLVVISVITVASMFAPQEQTARTETLHVTGVERKTEDQTYGATIHISATADSKTIHYRIHCEETLRSDGKNTLCFHIQAGRDYEVKIGRPRSTLRGPTRVSTCSTHRFRSGKVNAVHRFLWRSELHLRVPAACRGMPFL